MNQKLTIYVLKASLAPVVISTALWAKGEAHPTTWVLLALVMEAAWQGINAWGAYLSDPANPKPNETKTQPETKPAQV